MFGSAPYSVLSNAIKFFSFIKIEAIDLFDVLPTGLSVNSVDLQMFINSIDCSFQSGYLNYQMYNYACQRQSLLCYGQSC